MDSQTDGPLMIDSEEARELVAQLAALTGESVSDIVTGALRIALERQRHERDIDAKVERVMTMAREIRAHLKGSGSSDTSDFYDENGFPA